LCGRAGTATSALVTEQELGAEFVPQLSGPEPPLPVEPPLLLAPPLPVDPLLPPLLLEPPLPVEPPLLLAPPLPPLLLEPPLPLAVPPEPEPPLPFAPPRPVVPPLLVEPPLPFEPPLLLEPPLPFEPPLLLEPPLPFEPPLLLEPPLPFELPPDPLPEPPAPPLQPKVRAAIALRKTDERREQRGVGELPRERAMPRSDATGGRRLAIVHVGTRAARTRRLTRSARPGGRSTSAAQTWRPWCWSRGLRFGEQHNRDG
jgi:hypothetical protein